MTDTPIGKATALIGTAHSFGRAPAVSIFFDETTFTATNVVHDPASRCTAIIDFGARFRTVHWTHPP
jgi:hypothetical protein